MFKLQDQRSRYVRNGLRQICLVTCLVVLAERSMAQGPDERTLEMMVRLGLNEAAEQYVVARTELVTDNPPKFAHWKKREMEVYAQQALRASGDSDSRQEAWAKCRGVYDAFQQAHAESPRLPWLVFQQARCDLLQAQSELARYLAAPANTKARESALALVRQIVSNCGELQRDIQARQPLAAREGLNSRTQAPVGELSELKVDTVLLECEALLVRMRLYMPDSTDRTAAATQVEQRANDVLSRTGEKWKAVDALKVAQASSRLELGRADEALVALAQLAKNAKSPALRQQAALVATEYLARIGQASRARQALQLAESIGSGPGVALGRIQLELASVAKLEETAKAKKLSELVTAAKSIGAEYGGYWQNRAEALLTGVARTDSASTSADLMLVKIRQMIAAGEDEAAIDRLVEYVKNEVAANSPANAMLLGQQAVALLRKQEDWTRAAQVAQEVAFAFPEQESAPKLSLLGGYALSQRLRLEATPELKSKYESALIQHLRAWPDHESASLVKSWLRTWLFGNGRKLEYLNAQLGRAAETEQAELCYEYLLDWLGEYLLASDELRTPAIEQLRLDWNDGAFVDANAAASVVLIAEGFNRWPDQQRAQQIDGDLQSQLRATSLASSQTALLKSLEMLRLVQQSDAQNAGKQASTWDPSQLPLEVRQGMATGFAEAISESRQGGSVWASLLKLDREVARALAEYDDPKLKAVGARIEQWLGDPKAVAKLGKLVEANPRNGWVNLELANALAESGKMDASTRIAKRIAASSKPGSELNLASRWRWIKNLKLMGEDAKAKQTAALLLVSQPLEAGIWKERFESAQK